MRVSRVGIIPRATFISILVVSSAMVLVPPASANALVTFKTQPRASTVVNAPLNEIDVRVTNVLGLGVSGVQVQMTLAPNGTALGGTKTKTTGSGGIAAFTDLTVSVVANGYKLTATALNGAGSATSNSFNIVPAGCSSSSLCHIVWTVQPQNQAENQMLAPVSAKVLDAANQPQPGRVVTLALSAGPGTLSPASPSSSTGTDGVATFSGLQVTKGAPTGTVYTLTASSTDTTPQASGNFTISDCTTAYPCRVSFVGQPADTKLGQTVATDIFGNDGGAHPVTVQVNDNAGDPISGRSVTVSLTNGASLAGTTTRQTNASGVATFNDLSSSTGQANPPGFQLVATAPEGTAPPAVNSSPFGNFTEAVLCGDAGSTCSGGPPITSQGTTFAFSFTTSGSQGVGGLIGSALTAQQWADAANGFKYAPDGDTEQIVGSDPQGPYIRSTITITKGVRLKQSDPSQGVAAYSPLVAVPAAPGTQVGDHGGFHVTTSSAGGRIATGLATAVMGSDGLIYWVGAPALSTSPDCGGDLACTVSVNAGKTPTGQAAVVEVLLSKDKILH